MFSALSVSDREIIIDICLEKLIKLAKAGYIFGIQISGVSLDIIQELRPNQLAKLKEILKFKNVELIGNGYSQIVQPLAPWIVNLKNQEIGKKRYADLLECTPNIATINEMAFSAGSTISFLENGYDAVLMEWNNCYKNNPEWDDKIQFFTQNAQLGNNKSIEIIWGNSVVFQKFQRYVHGEQSLEEYINWLKENYDDDTGYLCLYCSDAEIFGFRPRRYGTELNPEYDEWLRIEKLFSKLSSLSMKTILPSQARELKNENNSKDLIIESSKEPIIVKKQLKYNINRWALSGKNDFELNTKCYRLFNAMIKTETNQEDWENLCKLWSSDLRTHIENRRWEQSMILLESMEKKYLQPKKVKKLTAESDHKILNEKIVQLTNEGNELKVDTYKGGSILNWRVDGKDIMGTIPHGYFNDIAYAADFYSGHSVIEQQGEHIVSDLGNVTNIAKSSINSIYIDQTINKIKFKKKLSLISPNSISLEQEINLPNRKKEVIRNAIFTFLPEAWENKSLYFKTYLGGEIEEEFRIKDNFINQIENLNQLVTGLRGFTSTEGILKVGDREKELHFRYDMTQAALMPKIFFHKIEENKFLFRINFVGQELDETFRESDKDQKFKHKINIEYKRF
tara:strand:- start:1235 stop:3106 length:1872 start_codon:yes stop_codon:yes gene_type:complete